MVLAISCNKWGDEMAHLEISDFSVNCIEPEGEWLYELLPAIMSIDKPEIVANGIDAATITAEVPPELAEIVLSHADTSEVLATIPVDPEAHTATLQVMATAPGTIRIRAGYQTITRHNEVTINASS